jgi:class 3 adenylate cyclase/tetratricopeptide (TPR) repeat protein
VAVCPSCGEDNPERARFCLGCGTALATEAGPRIERKYATALFADIVGSTALAEREDPEVVRSVVGRAFDRLAIEIERYGGLLEKFVGDAVLAVFGVPRSHEDDPERAVRAALDLQDVLAELNRAFAAEGAPELSMRIGVEAGDVLADLERAEGPRERMLTGDAVNTAARLQSAAEPGQVLVGPVVYAATKEAIDFAPLPPLALKGKAEPVPAWRALRVRARVRGERPALGIRAQMVGRDEELALLTQTLQRVASEARPALVTIVGSAGVGKSRLVAELLGWVEARPEIYYWRSGRCLAYGAVSYSALADAVKAQCEVLEDDPVDVVGSKVEAAAIELLGGTELVPYLAALVGTGDEVTRRREELFEAWRRFLDAMAARRPLVLAIEDLHWADPGLLDFLEYLADWAEGPLLILSTSRPELLEIRPTWGGGKRNVTSIFLEPLTPEEDRAMLEDLLGGQLSANVEEAIVERAEGNPLFTEEIVRSLIDRGVLRATSASRWEIALPVEEVELPRSIGALIAARLDTLPTEEKELLQRAAVVGRIFWSGALEALTGREPGSVREALGRLRVKELLVPHEPSTFSGEIELAFRHVLIRDSAYESLPKAARVDQHLETARWATGRAGGRGEELAELIGSHYRQALGYLDELGRTVEPTLAAEALSWLRSAGDRALALWQRSVAVGWYREALELAELAGIDRAELLGLWRAYGMALHGVETWEVTAEAFERVRELADALGDDTGAGDAEDQLALIAFVRGRLDEATELAKGAVRRLEPLGDSVAFAQSLGFLGRVHWRRARYSEAERILRQAVEVAERVGALEVVADATITLGSVVAAADRLEGLALLERSVGLAKRTGDLDLVLRAQNNLASEVADYGGDYHRAEELYREALEIARKAGDRSWQTFLLGNLGDIARDYVGDLRLSERCTVESLEIARAIGEDLTVAMRTPALAATRLLLGEVDDAAALYRESVRLNERAPEPQTIWLQLTFGAMLATVQGDDEAADERSAESCRVVVDAMGTTILPYPLSERVRILIRLGRVAEARQEAAGLPDLESLPPQMRALALVVRGLVAPEPSERVDTLREAAAAFDSMGLRIHLARCLLDLGRAEREAGLDPRASLERARDLLVECDCRLYLPEAEAELGTLPA